MRIAVFYPEKIPVSSKRYADNVIRVLGRSGVDFFRFKNRRACLPQDVDVIWDPRCGRSAPPIFFPDLKTPIVATFHGAVHLVLPAKECYGAGLVNYFKHKRDRKKTISEWQDVKTKLSAIITVSNYAKKEFCENIINIPEKIYPIYHGVDFSVFNYSNSKNKRKPNRKYFFHLSSYQPKKNPNRIIKAYQEIKQDNKPDLVMVLANYKGRTDFGNGVEIITKRKMHDELAELLRDSFSFVFPSLHETFGMPIIEAMACGVPVITSNQNACKEVAGNAALFVNPRAVDDIRRSMKQIIADESLRAEMSEKGLARAKKFTWEKSAEKHLEIFKKILSEK